MKLLSAVAAMLTVLISTQAWAVTAHEVDFANRQCAQRGDPDKCRIARNLARSYNQQERDKLEYSAAVKAGQPMNGSVNVYIDTDPNGDNKGAYRWNQQRGKYCYHNSSGSVNRCIN